MIGGNKKAVIQIRNNTKNDIGESVTSWIEKDSLVGFLDLSGGDSKYQTYNRKAQESSHIFIADWKELASEITAENSRMVIDGKIYDIMLIDNPMELNEHFEIYLQYRG